VRLRSGACPPGLLDFVGDVLSTRVPGPYLVAAPGAWYAFVYDTGKKIDQRFFPKK
jgi:hypothetical protein